MRNTVVNVKQAAAIAPHKFHRAMAQFGRVKAAEILYTEFLDGTAVPSISQMEIILNECQDAKKNGEAITVEVALQRNLTRQLTYFRNAIISWNMEVKDEVNFAGFIGNSTQDCAQLFNNFEMLVDNIAA